MRLEQRLRRNRTVQMMMNLFIWTRDDAGMLMTTWNSVRMLKSQRTFSQRRA